VWSFSLSVCVPVFVDREQEPCENGGTDRDAVWDVNLWDPENHELDGVHIDATWRIRRIDPRATAMQPCVRLLRPAVVVVVVVVVTMILSF